MSRTKDGAEEIREMALSAAEAIIDEHGYASLSARKVASAIGYTVGTLYLVFHNLDDLILQVNGRTVDALYARLTEAMDNCEDGTVGVLALGHGYLEFATSHPGRWGAIFEHNLPAGDQIPEWLPTKVARSFGLVEGELRRLVPNRAQTEIAKAARALWSGVHGVCILGLTERLGIFGAGSLEELVESLIANYLAGFSHPEQ